MNPVVCLPTRNEISSIQLMIDEVKALGLPLFISDQASTDGTQEAAARSGVQVFQREGQGKGCGVQTALKVADRLGHDVLVLIDCDHSYPTQHIPELLRKMEETGAEMVVGCRPFANVVFSHRLVNHLHTGAINLLYGADYHDINSGLRALKVEKFRGLLTAPGFDIEAQISCVAAKRGMKVAEVPCGYERRLGESKIRAWDTWVILKRILRERFATVPDRSAA
jgi:glycosyltransferase involved in cell wall biosynthesis